MIIAVMLVASIVMIAYLLNRTKEYTAYADILIGPSSNEFGNLEEDTDQRSEGVTPSDMESEARLISSSHVLQLVMDGLELSFDEPSFDIKSALLNWISTSSAKSQDQTSTSVTTRLEAFRERLSIERDPLAYVITVGYRAKDPDQAALIANTLADTYLEDRIEARRQSLTETAENLRRSVDDMGAWIKATERQIDDFRADSDLYAVGGTSPAEQRYNTLSRQLTEAELEVTNARSRLSQVDEALTNGQALDNLREVQTSQVINDLRNQESEIQREIADLSTRLGKNHPVMTNAKAELQDVQQSIKLEIDRVIGQLRSEANVAANRFISIEKQVAAAQENLANSQAMRIRLNELERDAEAPRRVYETMLERYQRAREQEKILADPARVIGRATAPDRPSNMSGLLLLGLTVAGSCAAGVGFAFLLEARRPGYTNAQQIEQDLGYPVISMIPFVHDANDSRGDERWRFLEAYGFSEAIRKLVARGEAIRTLVSRGDERLRVLEAYGFTEAIRTLVYTLLPKYKMIQEGMGKTVAFTSSFPDEGKSTIALTLARQASFSGIKTLLIEGDLRKPGLHAGLTTVQPSHGLVHLLRGEKNDVFQCVETEPDSGVDIMLGFGPADDAFMLLRGERMLQLLEAVRSHYDLVVLDCAPVMAVSESRSLVDLADETVFVIRWQSTERSAAKVAIQDLERLGGKIAGVVLNQVELKEHLKYQDADRLAYQEKYKDYIVT